MEGIRKIDRTKDFILKLFDKNLFDSYFKNDTSIYYKINTTYKNVNINIKHNTYNYEEFMNKILAINKIANIVINIYIKIYNAGKIDPFKVRNENTKIIKKLQDNLPAYVNQKKMLNDTVANDYFELWEILNRTKLINTNKNTIEKYLSFHFAALPGNYIISLERYLNKFHKNEYKYIWRANNLNPAVYDELIYKYDNDRYNINFYDGLDLYKDNEDKFLWGKDNTGDIKNLENIKWFRQYIQQWKITQNNSKLNLITGAPEYKGEYADMQKLDIAMMINVLASSDIGGDCIIKTFMPWYGKEPVSDYSFGYLINLIYTYSQYFEYIYLIRPSSIGYTNGQFYIVGKNFKGIDDSKLEDFYLMYAIYKVNHCWYNEKDIDKDFKNKVFNFINEYLNYMEIASKIRIIMMYCSEDLTNDEKKYLECSKYDKKVMEENNNTLIKKWIKDNNFE